jgi:hypothetical protein
VVLEHDQEQEESKLEETASHTCHPKPAAQVTFGPIITQNLVTKCDQLGGGFQDLNSLGHFSRLCRSSTKKSSPKTKP